MGAGLGAVAAVATEATCLVRDGLDVVEGVERGGDGDELRGEDKEEQE